MNHNMMRIICLLVIGFSFLSSNAFGHPPKEIVLKYSKETQKLFIQVNHVTHNTRKHFIRKINVTVNDGETQKFTFVQQTTPKSHQKEISLDLAEGDVVRVKAFCNLAGSREATLTIP